MKKIIYAFTIILITHASRTIAQESYGHTLNAGLGVGYYGYHGYATPALNVNYEFDVAKNFTLAPFISAYGYHNDYYWGDPHDPRYPYRYYRYRETVIPVGVKGSYYFDQLFDANEKWDFYLAASLGYTFRKAYWEDNYYGPHVVTTDSYLYLDGHIGAEYHATQKLGIYLDLSTGMSTVGLAVHF